ncbi:trace amine-associated receptor 1 [Nematostella vectensis]|uniref:trace amine-associated receptor 1 n=1 Tax=Nematostella vectensis TaxID=45351 RepID=UPI002076FDD2|nr:trace amine-associated receptor 1 [Nematostella vectensis]
MVNESEGAFLGINNRSSSEAFPGRDLPKIYVVRGIISIILAFVTSLANGFVIFLFIKDPHRKIRNSPTNVLISSLAFVDFSVGILLEPISAFWYLTYHVDKAVPFHGRHLEMAEAFLLLVSVFHLLGITRDRVMAVLSPLQYSQTTRKKSYLVVVCIWVYCVAAIISLRFIGKSYLRNIIFCLHIDIAIVVSVVLFACVLYSLRKQTKTLQSFNVDRTVTLRAVKREKKVTKTMGLMLAVFILCTLPWFVMMQMLPLCKTCQRNMDKLIWAFKLTFVLFQANCALNPFLCAWRLPKYNAALKAIFRSSFSHPRKWSQQTTLSLSMTTRNSSLVKFYNDGLTLKSLSPINLGSENTVVSLNSG